VATALRVSGVDDVAVAVDEPSVLAIAKAHGIKAVLTSKDHQSGTDRINEAAQILGLSESEIIINVQADEPFIEPENIAKFRAFCERYALYFSRSRIPFNRSECKSYKAHLGIYGYSVKSLKEFCGLLPSSLENTEKLEQLRALENGKKIAMLEVESQSIGIDSEEDYQRALAKFGK